MIYDIVGDIHGQATKLTNLLNLLGYKQVDRVYQQAGHTLVFIGDLIDRGPHQKQVLDIVRPMVSQGSAHVVMGNHEFNAICYHTARSDTNGNEWLRPHTTSKYKQHKAFLAEFPLRSALAEEAIDWFKSLPLFLDFGPFRVIHACWDYASIMKAHEIGLVTSNNRLNLSLLADSATEGNTCYDIIERLLKGPEISGVEPFYDKDGHIRHELRTRWWGSITDDSTLQDIAFWYNPTEVTIPNKHVPGTTELPLYSARLPPVFFGHYWLNHELKVQTPNVCCLDYSAGKKGPLVAYRFNPKYFSGLLDKKNLFHAY